MKRSSFILVILFHALCFFAKAQNLGVQSVLSPVANACVTNYSSETVVVRIVNVGPGVQSNFSVSYSVNGGAPVTETCPVTLAVGASTDYTFVTPFTKVPGVNDVKVYTSLPGDLNTSNDVGTVRVVTRIASFPYCQDFEQNNGGFAAAGSNSSWGWGTPNKTLMKPGQGTKSWYNGFGTGDGFYLPSDFSTLTSPCFDFTNLNYAYISFKLFIEVENGWESVTLEYSTNGSGYAAVGNAGEANGCNTQNWFNVGTTWSGNTGPHSSCGSWGGGCPGNVCGKWIDVRHCVDFLKGQPNVTFRLRFASSGSQCQAEGIGLDSFCVGEAAPPPFSFTANSACANAPVSFTPTLSPCITSTKWDFGDNTPTISTPTAIHVYRNPGTYNAKLIVTSYCGKPDTFTRAVNILPPPVVTPVSGVLKNKYCVSDGAVILTGSRSPAGGSFFVDGTATASFDPSALGVGDHKVVYVYTEPSGNHCTNRDTQTISVYVPTVSIDSLGGSYCLASPAVTLKGKPAGGSFTVDGVAATTFDAAALGLGQHIVTYTYSDSAGCTGIATRLVDVVSNIVAQINGLSSSYCSYEPAVTLTGTPSGGIFTIDGAVKSVLDPAQLTPGTHRVIYAYSDGGSCSDQDTLDVSIVKVTASINASLDSIYCFSSPVVTLAGKGSPAGGSFLVDGNPATTFNPAALSVSTHIVSYIYVDPVTSCTDTARKNVRIDKPVLKFTGVEDSYCKDAPAATLAATPAGGSFKLNGTSVTTIDPSTLDTGLYTLVYTYTDPHSNCTNTLTKNVYIAPLPKAVFVGLDTAYCITSDLVPLNASPSGGAFTIDNLPVQVLDPSLLSVGTIHTVAYQYVEQDYGCMVTISKPVRVVIPPAVSISGIRPTYCIGDSAFIPSGNPPGGKFVVDDVDTVTQVKPSLLTTGSHKLTYVFIAANGCDASVNQNFTINPLPTGTISPDPVSICEGESVALTFSGSEAITWNTGSHAKTITVAPDSSRFFWLNADACASFYDSVRVTVKPRPVASFVLNPEEGLLPLDILATAVNPSSIITWVVDNTDSVFHINPLKRTFDTPGTHAITLLVDTAGCKDSLTKTVNVIEKVVPIKLPNVFTPDNDGTNDDFGMNKDARRFVKELSFQVFNRWGNLLFTTSDPYQRWDGTDSGSKAPDGVYFYVLNATLSDSSSYNLTGSVTLIRGN